MWESFPGLPARGGEKGGDCHGLVGVGGDCDGLYPPV